MIILSESWKKRRKKTKYEEWVANMFSKCTRSWSWIHSEWIVDWTQPGISCQWTSQSVLDGQRQMNYYQSRNRKKCFYQERNTWQQLLPEAVKASRRWRFASAVKRAVTSKPYGVKMSPSFKETWRHAPWIKAIRTLKCSEWHWTVEE